MKKNSILLVIIAAGLIFLPSVSHAVSNYVTAFESLYTNAKGINCGVCHIDASGGGGSLNLYGTAWSKNAHGTPAQQKAAFIALESADSDADGYTNLTEIMANTATVMVLPGHAKLTAQFPAGAGYAAVPAKLLFYDNFKNANAATHPNWKPTPTTAAWTCSANKVAMTTPMAGNVMVNPAPTKAPAALTAFKSGTVSAKIAITGGMGNSANIIFSQNAAGTAYRYVQLSTTGIIIGQVGTVGGVAAASVTPKTIAYTGFAAKAAHTVKVVETAAGAVTVYVDNASKGSLKFTAAVAGKTGFMTKATQATFTNASFSK